MPSLARKILICAASDGLVLHSLPSKKDQRPPPSIKIRYGDAALLPASPLRDATGASFEAFGIVGLVSVSRFSYLISITRRQLVATIRGFPVYVATEVALTPCASLADAREAVEETARDLKRRPDGSKAAGNGGDSSSDSDSDSDNGGDSSDNTGSMHRHRHNSIDDEDGEPSLWPDDIGEEAAAMGGDGAAAGATAANSVCRPGSASTSSGLGPTGTGLGPSSGHGPGSAASSVAEDVMSRRGSYGRFAQRWFSRSGWMQEQKRLMGLTDSTSAVAAGGGESGTGEIRIGSSGGTSSAISSSSATVASTDDNKDSKDSKDNKDSKNSKDNKDSKDSKDSEDSAVVSLLPKLLRTTKMLFGASRAFYFSYDYDITRSLVRQPQTRWPATALPLHKRVDPLYFWNRHALQPFIEAGADALALPLMQGFIGQRSFVVDSHPPQTDDDDAATAAKNSFELSDLSYRSGSSPVLSGSGSPPPLPLLPRPLSPVARVASSPTSGRSSLDLEERRPTEAQFYITLISRRSVKRAGLRYLRRGVDEDGNVANAVETEQILSPGTAAATAAVTETTVAVASKAIGKATAAAAGAAGRPEDPWRPYLPYRTFSFVQVRGSIPLYFTQSPFSLKPVPVLQHSPEANYAALHKHFDGLRRSYGRLQVVNLVEKHGVEAAIGTRYEENVRQLNAEAMAARATSTTATTATADEGPEAIPFEWFDFHSACRGMKFENVSLLLNTLSAQIEELGSTVEEEEGWGGGGPDGPATALVRKQKGVLRTNCMDCLDRTNVCQSSFAKFMLESQLREQGFDLSAQRDQENAWFNTLWADNGDAVSKQYASTAAMKGDYTRTRKRDYRGALTDAGLSLTRFFNGIVNDFFLQTTIDFLLGNVNDKVFDEFEANMMTRDPAVSTQKMREQAIDLCQRRVVADEAEELVAGWTLLAPHDANASLTAPPFEEVVLLLTDAALYLCRFDWNLDKLSSFERVDLAHVQRITLGTYIVSTVSPMHMDESRNVGLLLTYQPGRDDILRINTRSLSSIHMDDAAAPASAPEKSAFSGFSFLARHPPPPPPPPPVKRLAFKALYAETSLAASAGGAANEQGAKLTEMQQVSAVAQEIERTVLAVRQARAKEEAGRSTKKTGAESGTGVATQTEMVTEGATETGTAATSSTPDSGPPTDSSPLLVHGDIVSLAEARKSTGLLGHLGHSLKKLVWA